MHWSSNVRWSKHSKKYMTLSWFLRFCEAHRNQIHSKINFIKTCHFRKYLECWRDTWFTRTNPRGKTKTEKKHWTIQSHLHLHNLALTYEVFDNLALSRGFLSHLCSTFPFPSIASQCVVHGASNGFRGRATKTRCLKNAKIELSTIPRYTRNI